MLKYIIAVAFLVSLVEATLFRPNGIVEGINDCGSEGKLGNVLVTDCEIVPCELIGGRTYDIQVYFTASHTSDALELNVYRIVDGTLIFLFLVPINGEIEEGLEYYLDFKLPVTSEIPGRSDIRFVIFNTEVTEICAEAAVIIRA